MSNLDKLRAWERINLLLDENSFQEIGHNMSNIGSAYGLEAGTIPYDGVITGYGTINGKKVCIYVQDSKVMGGTLGKMHGKKIVQIIDLAIKCKCPVIGIQDSGGARIQEGISAMSAYGEIFYYNTLASGYIPQICIIAGACAGGAVYSPGIADFIFTVEDITSMFVTGPKVIKQVTNQTISAKELGGAKIHSQISGVSHFCAKDERECYKQIKRLIDIIPSYYGEPKPQVTLLDYVDADQRAMPYILPKKKNQAYEMRDIIENLIDRNTFIEIQKDFAKNIIIGFAKISNILVGIVANQPNYMAGAIDCDASDKSARFVRYCDCFNIPLISLVDVPGFLPSVDEEKKGIIRHGAKLLFAYSEATVPKIQIVIRKAYGGAYLAMCSKKLGADFTYAWPDSEIAVMGAEGAVEIIYNKQLKTLSDEDTQIFLKEKIKEYKEICMNTEKAKKEGYIDDVIRPEETRKRIYFDLVMAQNKDIYRQINKKHGNIPL